MSRRRMVNKDDKPIFKIVVSGPFNCGKTTFLDSLVIRFSELDYFTLSPLLRGGWVDLQEALIYIFETLGSRRFDIMWEILAEGMLGFIIMVDSCNPQTFREAGSITQTFAAYAPVPYVIAANFQQRSTAWDLDALRLAMQIPSDVRIVPCDATDRESVKGVLIALLEEVVKDSQAYEDMLKL